MLYEVCSDLRHKSLNVIPSINIHYHELVREFCTKTSHIGFCSRFFSRKNSTNFIFIVGYLVASIFRELKICGWNLFAVVRSQCEKRKDKQSNSQFEHTIHTSIWILRDRWARWFGGVIGIQSENENRTECGSDSYLSCVRSRYFFFNFVSNLNDKSFFLTLLGLWAFITRLIGHRMKQQKE